MDAKGSPSLEKVSICISVCSILTMIVQRLHQWFNNQGKQVKNTSQNTRSTVKALVKWQPKQLWQAFAVLYHDPVKVRVDAEYPLYFLDATKNGISKPMSRLSYVKLTCLQMFEQCDEDMQEEVRKQRVEDTLDMPEYLIEAQDTLGNEEIKRYLGNYR